MAFSIGREKISQETEVKPIDKIAEVPLSLLQLFCYLASSYLRCSHLIVSVILHLSLKLSMDDHNRPVSLWWLVIEFHNLAHPERQ